MNIIDGKEIAKKLREKIAEEVKTLERPPGLAVKSYNPLFVAIFLL